jgi:hypothetical protein
VSKRKRERKKEGGALTAREIVPGTLVIYNGFTRLAVEVRENDKGRPHITWLGGRGYHGLQAWEFPQWASEAQLYEHLFRPPG